jgi:hypothetical protein
MPLQIRRGTTVQRAGNGSPGTGITPLPGELIYDTVEQKIYVGDGDTLGGNALTGLSTEDAQDAAAGLFTTGSHSGITFTYNDAAGRIDATVTVAATGPFDGDLTGSVFSDNSTLLVNGTDGLIVGDVRSNFVTFIQGLGTTAEQTTNASFTMRGNSVFFKDDYDVADVNFFNIQQHHSTADANPINIVRTRGTNAAPTAVINGDDIIDITFNGHDGTTFRTAASITVGVEGAVSTGVIPGYITFRVRQGASITAVAKIANTGAFQSNLLEALTTNGNITVQGNGTGAVNIEAVRINGSTISTTDSSSITVSQASTFSSNLTVDGTLTISDSIVQNNPNRDYVSTTLQTQGVARVVEGVQNGTYTQVTSSTAETYTAISYNSTTYRGCRALIKASYGATNVYIGEVLLANTTTTVTIVNAQATAATIGTSPISSVTADYDSETSSIRLRPVTASTLLAASNYNWTVSYQLFT